MSLAALLTDTAPIFHTTFPLSFLHKSQWFTNTRMKFQSAVMKKTIQFVIEMVENHIHKDGAIMCIKSNRPARCFQVFIIKKLFNDRLSMNKQETYPADCWNIATIDSHNIDRDWKRKNLKLIVQKNKVQAILNEFRSYTCSCFFEERIKWLESIPKNNPPGN